MSRDHRLEALTPHRSGDGYTLDLSSVGRLDPLHLVACAAFAHRAQRLGSWLHVHGLTPPNATYAARMKLGPAVESHGGRCDLPAVEARDRSDSLLELHRVQTEPDAAQWASLVHNRIHQINPQVAHALHTGLDEVGANIVMHAQTYGFVAAQMFPVSGVIRFAVADAGVGLLETLSGRGATSDKHAMVLALAGTSRLGGTHGMGLSGTWDNVARLGGSIVMATGGSSLGRTAGTGKFQDTFGRANFQGTIFEGCVPAHPPGSTQIPEYRSHRRRTDDLPHRRRRTS